MARGGRNALDITGQTFNYLEAVSRTDRRAGKHVIWEFKCVCGKQHFTTATDVKRGTIKSCGCMQASIVSKIKTTHGATKRSKPTRTYMVWSAMRKRCNNKNAQYFERYGGRGIKVCERWNSFENFLSDMGEAPPGMSIDRINNDGNYEPENCRWANSLEQGNNKQISVKITVDGETKSVTEWARAAGIHQSTLWHRLKSGMDPKLALFTPPLKRSQRKREPSSPGA